MRVRTVNIHFTLIRSETDVYDVVVTFILEERERRAESPVAERC